MIGVGLGTRQNFSKVGDVGEVTSLSCDGREEGRDGQGGGCELGGCERFGGGFDEWEGGCDRLGGCDGRDGSWDEREGGCELRRGG